MDKKFLVFLSFSIALASCFVKAQDSDRESMVVVTEEWAPYNYAQSDGKIVGSSTVIVEQTLKNSNIPYTLNIYPWARAYKLALNNANVLLYSAVRTPEREHLFHWVCPLNSVEYLVFKLASRKDIIINSLDDLKKHSTGVTRGTFLTDYFKQKGLVKGTHLRLTGDNQANFRNLLGSRVDLIVDTQAYIDDHLQKLGLPADHIHAAHNLSAEIEGTNSTCMAISLKTPMAVVNKIKSEHSKLINKAEK